MAGFDFGSGMEMPRVVPTGSRAMRPPGPYQQYGSYPLHKSTGSESSATMAGFGNGSGGGNDFDFGSGMPIPRSIPAGPRSMRPPGPHQQHGFSQPPRTNDAADRTTLYNLHGRPTTPARVLSLFNRADRELLGYLENRSVSVFFLKDIDAFVASYPELLKHCPGWCRDMSMLPPLQAYLLFVKGYLRPARYNDGALPRPDTIVIPRRPVELQYNAFDPELHDFFGDAGRCFDVLHEMDIEVTRLANVHHNGRHLYQNDLKLIVLHMYGQPIDALKYYQYVYKTALGTQRAREEHDILKYLRRPVKDGEQPQPCMRHLKHSYMWVRNAMAKANDRHQDVTVTLLDCFTEDLRRHRGLPRQQHVRLRNIARDMIKHQRVSGTGVDLVDMIMGLAKNVSKGVPDPYSKETGPIRRNFTRPFGKQKKDTAAYKKQTNPLQQHNNTGPPAKKSKRKRGGRRNKKKDGPTNPSGPMAPVVHPTYNFVPAPIVTARVYNNGVSLAAASNVPAHIVNGGVSLAAAPNVVITQAAPTQTTNPMSFKLNDPDVNFLISSVRQAYEYEALHPDELDVPKEVVVEEHKLAIAVGSRAMARGLMTQAEYEQLESLFPQREIVGEEEWMGVNPLRYSVLVLLDKWL